MKSNQRLYQPLSNWIWSKHLDTVDVYSLTVLKPVKINYGLNKSINDKKKKVNKIIYVPDMGVQWETNKKNKNAKIK